MWPHHHQTAVSPFCSSANANHRQQCSTEACSQPCFSGAGRRPGKRLPLVVLDPPPHLLSHCSSQPEGSFACVVHGIRPHAEITGCPTVLEKYVSLLHCWGRRAPSKRVRAPASQQGQCSSCPAARPVLSDLCGNRVEGNILNETG